MTYVGESERPELFFFSLLSFSAAAEKTYLLHKRGNGSWTNLNVSRKWMDDQGPAAAATAAEQRQTEMKEGQLCQRKIPPRWKEQRINIWKSRERDSTLFSFAPD
jgi:hypothetical protein